MLDIGLSTNGKQLSEQLFEDYRAAGITHMELSMSSDRLAALDFAATRRMADAHDVHLWSLHLPFAPFETNDISVPAIAAKSIALHIDYIKKCAAVGIPNVVIHPSGEPISDGDRITRMACAKESLFLLAERATQEGITVAVEDLPRTCLGRTAAEVKELIGVHDALRVCFDTNHLLRENCTDFVRALADKIVTVHVSDYDFADERHWLPGEGKNDWQAILAALDEVGYSGPWLYEIGFAAPATVKRERDLTCADFARNARELFANEPLTLLGVPNIP